MSKFILENPWNNFLEKIVINEDDKKVKELIVLKSEGHVHLFQSLPAKFQKLRDIVLCNNCEILISKRNCLIHSKFHENSINKYLPYNAFPSDDNIYIPSRSKTSSFINSNDKVSHNLLKEKKRKIIKKSKPSKHINLNKITSYDTSTTVDIQISEDHLNSKFIPKTIPNYRDPLKLKIRLQPKSASEKSRQKNGNIFDNLNSYYNGIKNHNQSLKSQRVRSMDELLSSDDLITDSRTISDNSNPSVVSNDDEKKPHMFSGVRRDTIRNVFSAENILKMRRMDQTEETGCRQIRGLSPGPPLSCSIPIIAKRVVPISNQTNSHTKISPVLAQCRAQTSIENPSVFQTHSVFQPINNRIIRINNQRKCVRIQQVEDNPTNWQLSASEKVPSAFYNQEATQKQFQRRLLQQGMISENDIIRCARTNVESDLGQRRKITIVNGLVSSNDSCIQVVRRTHPITSTSPRVIDTQNRRLPVQSTNPRNILYNKVMIDKNSPISIPSSVVHNPMSWSCQNVSNVELSDEEFILDSQFPNNHYNSTNNFSSSAHNSSGTPQYHSNILIKNDCSNNLSNMRSYPKSDPEIFSHTYQEDSMDPTIHFLPSPGSQIMGLPWDL